jgi:hypothetical protein
MSEIYKRLVSVLLTRLEVEYRAWSACVDLEGEGEAVVDGESEMMWTIGD